jgi:hypothetical protein
MFAVSKKLMPLSIACRAPAQEDLSSVAHRRARVVFQRALRVIAPGRYARWNTMRPRSSRGRWTLLRECVLRNHR